MDVITQQVSARHFLGVQTLNLRFHMYLLVVKSNRHAIIHTI